MATFVEPLLFNVIGTGMPLPALKATHIGVDSTIALVVKREVKDLAKTGTGSGDLRLSGRYQAIPNVSFRVQIDGAGNENDATFKWSDDGGATWDEELVAVTLEEYRLGTYDLYVQFAFGTYVLNDRWDFTAIGSGSQETTLLVSTTDGEVNVAAFSATTARSATNYDQGSVSVVPAVPPGGGTRQFTLDKATGIYQMVPRWLELSGHDSGPVMRAKYAQPKPLATGGLTGLTLANNNTVGHVGLVVLETPIMLHDISFPVFTAPIGAGSFRVALYTEAGDLITATNLTKSSLPVGVNTVTLAADIYLPAGNYYVLCCCNATAWATTQPTLLVYNEDTAFQTAPVALAGTVVVTAGAAPDPLGTITGLVAHTLAVRLVGAAT